MKNNEPYILYLGGIFSEETMLACPAVSPAANRWQMGLVRAFIALDKNARVLGHIPEPLWPKGRFRINKSIGGIAPGIPGELVNYWNVPVIRSTSLSSGYIRIFKDMCDTYGKPTCLISYNLYPHTVTIARYARDKYSIPWVCIVADAPNPGPRRDQHDQMLSEAAGRVFLPWKCFTDCRLQPLLHLDGGVESIRFSPNVIPTKDKKRAVLYSGVMNKYGGVDLLLKAFKLVEDSSIELWLCGKGENDEIRCAIEQDARIKWYGLVTDDRLIELSEIASAFINPRPVNLPASAGNFPSKILEYLSYGKPVISTWTEGLSPEYKEVLVVLENATPECLAHTVENVLAWDIAARQVTANKIYEFMNSKKLWSIQAQRLKAWLDTEILTERCAL
jgi:glycosyltransferase involved in cell wall biosynthesis